MIHLARLPAFVAEKATKQGSWSDTIIMELKTSAETRRNVMKKILTILLTLMLVVQTFFVSSVNASETDININKLIDKLIHK